MKPGFWFLAGGNHIFVVPGRNSDGWLFFWRVKSPCLSLNLDGGYPRQNNRGMSLDLIESSLGCPLGNWDPWDPDKSLEIPRLTWPKQPVPSHQGGIEPRWIFQTVNPKHGTMILLQPLQCFGQTCSLWWATRSQWTSVTRVWNTSNHTGIIRHFYSTEHCIYIYICTHSFTFTFICTFSLSFI